MVVVEEGKEEGFVLGFAFEPERQDWLSTVQEQIRNMKQPPTVSRAGTILVMGETKDTKKKVK